MKKTAILFLVVALFATVSLKAANVNSTNGSYSLLPTDVITTTATVTSDLIDNWQQNTSLKWNVNFTSTGKYLVKSNIASDWGGSKLVVTVGGSSTSSKAITFGWGTWEPDYIVGVIEVTTTGTQEFIATNPSGAFNIKSFTLEPISDYIDLSPNYASTTATEGITIEPTGDIWNWWNSSAQIKYMVQIPAVGDYKLKGSVATDQNLTARLTLAAAGSNAVFDFKGPQSWSYFFYQSTNSITFNSTGSTELLISRSGDTGFGAANINKLYLIKESSITTLQPKLSESVVIKCLKGAIQVSGASEVITVFNTNGTVVSVASPEALNTIKLAKGVYFVKSGSFVKKAIVVE